MILYHYTSSLHMPSIQYEGMIRTTESNIGSPIPSMPPYGDHYGPDVVWLTNRPDVSTTAVNAMGPKGDVCITVNVSGLYIHHWPKWAREQGINEDWYDVLANGFDPESWYISTRPIPITEWMSIDE